MDAVNNPHDKLFQEIYSQQPEARSFLEQYLPKHVLRLLDVERLEICKDSFVDDELKAFYSDLLYRVDVSGQTGYVYVLFEHKSYPARLIHLQMLEYILKIWQLHLKQHGGGEAGQLPIILPLLVYHGNRRWPYDSRLTSLLCGPIDELAAYIPDFRIIITDLTCFSDDEIKGTVLSRVVLLLFKHIFDPDLHSVLPEIFAMFRELEQQPTGLKYLEMLLRYLYSAADIAPDELTAIAQETLTGQGGEIAMTTAKQLEQRGYEQGMQQGMREGMLEAIELGLQLKFGVAGERMFSTIAKIQELVRLKAIKNSIPLVNDLSELQPLIEEP